MTSVRRVRVRVREEERRLATKTLAGPSVSAVPSLEEAPIGGWRVVAPRARRAERSGVTHHRGIGVLIVEPDAFPVREIVEFLVRGLSPPARERAARSPPQIGLPTGLLRRFRPRVRASRDQSPRRLAARTHSDPRENPGGPRSVVPARLRRRGSVWSTPATRGTTRVISVQAGPFDGESAEIRRRSGHHQHSRSRVSVSHGNNAR